MNIEIKTNTDPVEVFISGDIEMLSIKDLKSKLFDIGQNENKDIKLDLSEVNYIDSSGIGVLISLLKLQREKEKSLTISNVNPKVLEVLELSSLTDIFTIV